MKKIILFLAALYTFGAYAQSINNSFLDLSSSSFSLTAPILPRVQFTKTIGKPMWMML